MQITVNVPDKIINELRDGLNAMIDSGTVSEEDLVKIIAEDIAVRCEQDYLGGRCWFDPDYFGQYLRDFGYKLNR